MDLILLSQTLKPEVTLEILSEQTEPKICNYEKAEGTKTWDNENKKWWW